MSEKVSIIMATHETPKNYLNASIKSILNQNYSNIEFIVVCDGVEEEYEYILANYKDKRLKVLFNKQNKGLPFSLNRGIDESTGEYIARMDSDDISLPNRIEDELNFLKQRKLDLCGSAAYTFGDEYGMKKRLFASREDIKVWLLFMTTLVHPTVIGKSKVFKNNKYNTEFVCAQDFELWSRLVDKYSIGFLNKPLLDYRIHKKQASIAKGRIQYSMAKAVVEKNACKISGEYDEKVFKCLWLLGGRERITKSNYQEFSHLIDYVLRLNDEYKKYDRKAMKRIFCSRYFELSLKYKIFPHDYSSIKKILHLYNLRDLTLFGSNAILGKVHKHDIIGGEDKFE